MQGAYEREAKKKESLQMKILGRCKQRTVKDGLETTRSASIPHSAVNGNLQKFGATSSPVQRLHQCKVHRKGKLRGRRT